MGGIRGFSSHGGSDCNDRGTRKTNKTKSHKTKTKSHKTKTKSHKTKTKSHKSHSSRRTRD